MSVLTSRTLLSEEAVLRFRRGPRKDGLREHRLDALGREKHP